jgi:DNA-binding NtrC family response regulator
MQEVYRLIRQFSSDSSPVLIQGETGTGKELVARMLHEQGDRSAEPFFVLNCANLSGQLFESELFGHERGAFTGALSTKHGFLEAVGSGTLFLDEISETEPMIQAKLLRFLDHGSYYRVGSSRAMSSKARIVAATNRELEQEIADGRFRRDLFYRFHPFFISLPPLRDRLEDLEGLCRHFLGVDDLAPELVEVLGTQTWRGNVRELRGVLRRACLNAGKGVLPGVEHLPSDYQHRSGPDSLVAAESSPESIPLYREEKAKIIHRFETDYFRVLLERSEGNISLASRLAGLDRKYLRNKLRALGLVDPGGVGTSPPTPPR